VVNKFIESTKFRFPVHFSQSAFSRTIPWKFCMYLYNVEATCIHLEI